MRATTERLLDGGIVEREFTVDDVPGILWTPASATASAPVPLILLGHPGGIRTIYPRLETRARHSAGLGFATVAIEVPGSGARPSIGVDRARADLRQAIKAGERPGEEVIDRLALPLVEQAVPESQAGP